MIKRLILFAHALAGLCFDQLTTDQRLFDFDYLAARLAVSYAPYEWKRGLINFDH